MDLASKVISRVKSTLNGVTPTITLLINDLLSPLPLQVDFGPRGFSLQVPESDTPSIDSSTLNWRFMGSYKRGLS